jgi:hypothetical protein
MSVPMVDVRVMRVAVHQGRVHMPMGMRLCTVPREVVGVLVVLVVDVTVAVR